MQSKRRQKYHLVLIISLLSSISLLAKSGQDNSDIQGLVVDTQTGKPIPFVNIYFQNTLIGTTSNLDGSFRLRSEHYNDTLVFSMIGYQQQKFYVGKESPYDLTIKLIEDTQTLHEVVIRPVENPAHPILRNILKNKHKNNPERFSQSSFESYTSLQAQLTNVSKDKLKFVVPGFLVKTLPVATDSLGRPVLPFYLSEKTAYHYFDHANNISHTNDLYSNESAVAGLDDIDISNYETALSSALNFYNNYIELLGQNFVSPLAKNGLAYYNYELEDSTIVDGYTFYHINYASRNDKDFAFQGHFIVVKDLWAIQSIEANLPANANINYLNSFSVNTQFGFTNDSTLFYSSHHIKSSFHYLKIKDEVNTAMIEVDKSTVYAKVLLGKDAIPYGNLSIQSKPLNDAVNNDSALQVYRKKSGFEYVKESSQIIDSTNKLWWVKVAKKTANMFITGYYNVGKIDLGPYLGTFSTNTIEGTRLNFGLRTSEKFNPNYSVGGSLGYGFKDKEWKYSVFGQYKLKSAKRTIITVSNVKDLFLFGVNSYNHLINENRTTSGEDSFIASAFKRFDSDRRSMLYRWNVSVEKEWRRGFSTELIYGYDKLRQGVYVDFIHEGEPVDYIYNNSISMRLRFSWKENTRDLFMRRYYLNTFYPVLNIVGTGGSYSVAGNTGQYFKFHVSMKHKVPIGFMHLNYVLETGMVLGKVPFPLLNIVRGNDTYSDSKDRFNLLNNATAATDKYTSAMAEYHFNGMIMNKVPLLRSLNTRIVVSGKYFWGSLSDKHQEVLEYPWDMHVPGNQYLELGAGFENIFRLIRVEAIWRPVPKEYPGMPNYGVRVRFDFGM